MPYEVFDERVETASGHVSLGTMHLAKGLEFRAAAVMAGDDEVIPLKSPIETVAEDSDLATPSASCTTSPATGTGASARHQRGAGVGVFGRPVSLPMNGLQDTADGGLARCIQKGYARS